MSIVSPPRVSRRLPTPEREGFAPARADPRSLQARSRREAGVQARVLRRPVKVHMTRSTSSPSLERRHVRTPIQIAKLQRTVDALIGESVSPKGPFASRAAFLEAMTLEFGQSAAEGDDGAKEILKAVEFGQERELQAGLERDSAAEEQELTAFGNEFDAEVDDRERPESPVSVANELWFWKTEVTVRSDSCTSRSILTLPLVSSIVYYGDGEPRFLWEC